MVKGEEEEGDREGKVVADSTRCTVSDVKRLTLSELWPFGRMCFFGKRATRWPTDALCLSLSTALTIEYGVVCRLFECFTAHKTPRYVLPETPHLDILHCPLTLFMQHIRCNALTAHVRATGLRYPMCPKV